MLHFKSLKRSFRHQVSCRCHRRGSLFTLIVWVHLIATMRGLLRRVTVRTDQFRLWISQLPRNHCCFFKVLTLAQHTTFLLVLLDATDRQDVVAEVFKLLELFLCLLGCSDCGWLHLLRESLGLLWGEPSFILSFFFVFVLHGRRGSSWGQTFTWEGGPTILRT